MLRGLCSSGFELVWDRCWIRFFYIVFVAGEAGEEIGAPSREDDEEEDKVVLNCVWSSVGQVLDKFLQHNSSLAQNSAQE